MENNIIRKRYPYILFIVIIIITAYLIKISISSKEFNDLYKFNSEEIIGGTIEYDGNDWKLTSKEMKEFVSLLRNSEYYKRGKVSNVIEGYLYHIEIHLKGDKFIYIILSDQESLIKSDVEYKITSPENINEYIRNMSYENRSDKK